MERIVVEIDRKLKADLKADAEKNGTTISFIVRSLLKSKKYGDQTSRTTTKKVRN